MSFPYKKILVIGATSGIGEALAERFIVEGSSVIAVGRRQERLTAFEQKHGQDKATSASFDITQSEKIQDFAASITKAHPDLDCIFLNSGIQRSLDFSRPETVDMSVVQEEFNTNYLSFLALTKAFLPFLLAKKEDSALIYTTSTLGLVPIPRCMNYCASKAALHHFILCLRDQLRDSKVKVVEIYPPAVQTELHDERHQPDIKNGRSIGMPLEDFTDQAFEGLVAGKEDIPVGRAVKAFDAFERARIEMFHQFLGR